MIRVKRGVTKHARHKAWLAKAKGYRGRASTCYTIARERVERGYQHAFAHRKQFKREMRSLWISRLNAACRASGQRYSAFIAGINKLGVELNRKMLSEMAIHSPALFHELVSKAINAAAPQA